MDDRDTLFYKMGKVMLMLIAVAFLCYYTIGVEWLAKLPRCYFHTNTGLYCPGCGGTRAVLSLLKFRLTESFFYHPIVLYLLVLFLIFMIEFFLKKKGMIHKIPLLRIDIGMYIGIAIIILQCIIKNVCFLVYDITWLAA